MARRKNMMKFVVPTALALGKRAITRWPLFAAALGGAVAYGLFSRRRTNRLGKRVRSWTAKDAKPATESVASTEPEVATFTATVETWSPTTPTAAW